MTRGAPEKGNSKKLYPNCFSWPVTPWRMKNREKFSSMDNWPSSPGAGAACAAPANGTAGLTRLGGIGALPCWPLTPPAVPAPDAPAPGTPGPVCCSPALSSPGVPENRLPARGPLPPGAPWGGPPVVCVGGKVPAPPPPVPAEPGQGSWEGEIGWRAVGFIMIGWPGWVEGDAPGNAPIEGAFPPPETCARRPGGRPMDRTRAQIRPLIQISFRTLLIAPYSSPTVRAPSFATIAPQSQ